MRTFFSISVALFIACGGSQDIAPTGPVAEEPVAEEPVSEELAAPAGDTYTHVSIADVQWEALDPKAGDKGPMLAPLWGDRTTGPAGFLIKAPENFPGAPHVHTADYRAVVLMGEVHNDVPDGKELLMTAGSFWSEPGGRAHITRCKAACMSYVQFDGAFEMLAPDKTGASPGGITAVNTVAASLQFVNPPGTPEGVDSPVKLAMAWGDPTNGQPNGFFVKLPAGSPGAMHTHTSDYHAVVVQGNHKHWEPGGEPVVSQTGSYFWQKGGTPHQDACGEGDDCIIYVNMQGVTDMTMVEHK